VLQEHAAVGGFGILVANSIEVATGERRWHL
jgi:hypothetical protein